MLFDLTGHATKHDRLKRALSFIRFGSYYAVLASVIERKKKIKVLGSILFLQFLR